MCLSFSLMFKHITIKCMARTRSNLWGTAMKSALYKNELDCVRCPQVIIIAFLTTINKARSQSFRFIMFLSHSCDIINHNSSIKAYGQQQLYHNEYKSLQWRHNGHDSVSNHQPHACLLQRLFRRRSKKTSKLRVTGLFVGTSAGDRWIPRTNGQ